MINELPTPMGMNEVRLKKPLQDVSIFALCPCQTSHVFTNDSLEMRYAELAKTEESMAKAAYLVTIWPIQRQAEIKKRNFLISF